MEIYWFYSLAEKLRSWLVMRIDLTTGVFWENLMPFIFAKEMEFMSPSLISSEAKILFLVKHGKPQHLLSLCHFLDIGSLGKKVVIESSRLKRLEFSQEAFSKGHLPVF